MSLNGCGWLRGQSLVLCTNFSPARIVRRGPFQIKPSLRQGSVQLRNASSLCRHGGGHSQRIQLGKSGITAFAMLGGINAVRAYCSEKVDKAPINAADSTPKPKTTRSGSFKKILAFAKPEKGRIALGIGLLFVSSAVTMLVPYGIGKVIDMIVDVEGGMSKLKTVTGTIAAVFLVGGLANFGRVYLFQTSSNNIIAELRKRVFRSIMTQEAAFFDKNQSGELLNRLSADTQLVGKTLTDNISDILRSSAQATAGFAMMAYMSPKLTTAVLGVVPVIGGLAMVYGRFVKKLSNNVQDSLANASQVAGERISNIRTVRAFAQEDLEIERYNLRVEEVVQLGRTEALARGLFFGSTGMTGNFIMLSVLWFGGQMMHSGDITVGNLTSFLLYTAYVGVSIVGIGTAFSDIMKGVGASNRLFEIMEKTPTIPIHGGMTIPKEKFKGAIEFQNVDFSYEGRDVRVFQSLKLSIPPHTVLGVVGPSGSGKSSLGSLLFRLYDVNAGSVLIDGHDIRELDMHWLRSNIGVVSQEPVLFSGTIAENIAYGCPDATAEQIVEAAKKANAHQFIEEFPDGFATVVGERGQSLSGGQRQRVAIARALLLNPTILILDEATSALDSESERLVQDALEKHLLVGRTVITIAHRLSTIKHANSVAVLDDGKIVEQGTYKDLMNNPDGHFRRLVERQAYVLHE